MLFYCVLSILALICLALMALLCAAFGRDSVTLLMFPFLSHIHVFSCKMSPVSLLKRQYSYFSSPFLISGCFHSFRSRVVCIVSGGCKEYSSALFHVVFESLYRCFVLIAQSSSFFPAIHHYILADPIDCIHHFHKAD